MLSPSSVLLCCEVVKSVAKQATTPLDVINEDH